jgi:hypothetical protein
VSDQLRWVQPPGSVASQPLIREPARLGAVLGAALTMLGMLLPWATGIDQHRNPVSFSPIVDADGVLFVWTAIAAAILVLSRNAAESRTRTLQASTGVVGITAVLDWITAARAGPPPVVAGEQVLWLNRLDSGVPVTALGAALLATCGVRIAVRAWRHNGTIADPLDVEVTPRSVAGGAIQGVCAVAGGLVGLYGPLIALGPYALVVMTLGALCGGGFGLSIGRTIANRVTASSVPVLRERVRVAGWTDTAPRF